MAKILVIEDNEMNRDLFARRLRKRGHVVAMAVDGAEGVAMARWEVPNLIIMDIQLPVIDGWQATRELRAHHATSRVPIIAVTAHAMAGDRERCMAVGCDDYETKPIDWERLLNKVDALLAGKTSRVQPE